MSTIHHIAYIAHKCGKTYLPPGITARRKIRGSKPQQQQQADPSSLTLTFNLKKTKTKTIVHIYLVYLVPVHIVHMIGQLQHVADIGYRRSETGNNVTRHLGRGQKKKL